jgi:site-specific DNA-methyltransferase (adenine-specific)
MAVRIEDAGFEIRDMIAWVYGSGFPKSLDVSKAIDKAAGVEREVVGSKLGQAGYSLADNGRTNAVYGDLHDPAAELAITAPATPAAQQWAGWGTALKPALEPITMARKPLTGTVAANVLEHGTGALNVDGCRVGVAPSPTVERRKGKPPERESGTWANDRRSAETYATPRPGEQLGRWPANLITDGSDEVVGLFPETTSGALNRANITAENGIYGKAPKERTGEYAPDSGSAARFFYTAKATRAERQGTSHPTTKPLDLMAYLCRLVTPPGGTVLDPFMGSGTTIKAAIGEGFNAIGIERDPAYFAMAEHRMNGAQLGLLLTTP